MFIFIFLCCFLTTEREYCNIREIATFLEVLEFLRLCAHKHLPMRRGTTFPHIHRGPPYTFAQITPLNPILWVTASIYVDISSLAIQTISINQITSCFQSVRESTLVDRNSSASKNVAISRIFQ